MYIDTHPPPQKKVRIRRKKFRSGCGPSKLMQDPRIRIPATLDAADPDPQQSCSKIYFLLQKIVHDKAVKKLGTRGMVW